MIIKFSLANLQPLSRLPQKHTPRDAVVRSRGAVDVDAPAQTANNFRFAALGSVRQVFAALLNSA